MSRKSPWRCSPSRNAWCFWPAGTSAASVWSPTVGRSSFPSTTSSMTASWPSGPIPGTKLTAAAQGQVAFEVDEIDESARTGWSVLVTGVGYEVTDALDATSVATRRFPVDTWAPGQKSHWIRIQTERLSGRRVRPR